MLRTAHLDEPRDRALSLCGLGLAGEAGEVADFIKKVFYHHKPMDRQKLIEETGDLMWYVAYFCHTLDFDLDKLIDHANQPPFELFLDSDLTPAERYTRIGIRIPTYASDLARLIDIQVFFSAGSVVFHQPLKSLLAWIKALCAELDTTLEDVCRSNIAKLEKRYPNGFNTADSLARKDMVK